MFYNETDLHNQNGSNFIQNKEISYWSGIKFDPL